MPTLNFPTCLLHRQRCPGPTLSNDRVTGRSKRRRGGLAMHLKSLVTWCHPPRRRPAQHTASSPRRCGGRGAAAASPPCESPAHRPKLSTTSAALGWWRCRRLHRCLLPVCHARMLMHIHMTIYGAVNGPTAGQADTRASRFAQTMRPAMPDTIAATMQDSATMAADWPRLPPPLPPGRRPWRIAASASAVAQPPASQRTHTEGCVPVQDQPSSICKQRHQLSN